MRQRFSVGSVDEISTFVIRFRVPIWKYWFSMQGGLPFTEQRSPEIP